MSVLSIIALVFGVLGVVLTIRENIWCWPCALISVVTSAIEFYDQKLYGDMGLQVFYFFAGIYGWVYWEKNRGKTFEIKKTDRKQIPALILATVIQAVIYYFLITHYKGDRPVLDSILTACSLTATYMMTKKWIENWMAWVVIDAAYLVLYGLKEMWLFMVLYFVFSIIAFYGFMKWRKAV